MPSLLVQGFWWCLSDPETHLLWDPSLVATVQSCLMQSCLQSGSDRRAANGFCGDGACVSWGAMSCRRDALLTLAPVCFLLSCFSELLLLFSGNGSTAEWIFSSGVFHVYNTFLPGSVSSTSERRCGPPLLLLSSLDGCVPSPRCLGKLEIFNYH